MSVSDMVGMLLVCRSAATSADHDLDGLLADGAYDEAGVRFFWRDRPGQVVLQVPTDQQGLVVRPVPATAVDPTEGCRALAAALRGVRQRQAVTMRPRSASPGSIGECGSTRTV